LLIFFSLAVTASFGAGAAAMAIGEPSDLKGAKDYAQFMEADFSSGAEVIDFVNAHFTGKGSRFNTLISLPFARLPLAKRKKLIRLLASENELEQRLRANGDFKHIDLITHLLIYASEDDAWASLSDLETDDKLFRVLAQTHDFFYFWDGAFARLTDLVSRLSLIKNPAANDEQKVNALIEGGRYLIFDNSYTGNSNKEQYNTQTKRLTFEVKNSILEEFAEAEATNSVTAATNWLFFNKNKNYWEGSLEAKPLDNIGVIPVYDFTYRNTRFPKGVLSIMPAVAVYDMFKDDTRRALSVSGSLTANLVLTFTGAAVLGQALRAGVALTVAAEGVDITLGVGGSIINSIPEVEQNQPDFVKKYNKITIIYALARTGHGAYKALRVRVPGARLGNVEEFSDELLEAWSKFDDNALDLTVGKPQWKTFQNSVYRQLKARYPGRKIGSQITLDVTYVENGRTFTKTIIPDNLIEVEVNGVKKYKVIDAKTSQTDLVNMTDLTSTCTPNQKIVYAMIDGDVAVAGTITKVEMRGSQAKSAFGENVRFDGEGRAVIQLERDVEFWVNSSTTDYTQYLVRPRKK